MNHFEKAVSLVKERRAAPRHIAELKAPVLITAIGLSGRDTEECLFMHGRTHDVSVSGLALIISNEDRQELSRLGNEWVMHLLLPLPKEAIEIEVTPVRFQPFASGKTGEILVGAHITRINDRERVLFLDFIHECEASQRF